MNTKKPSHGVTAGEDAPRSRKVYVESDGLRVPMREIELGGGEAPLRVYDTTGPEAGRRGRGAAQAARAVGRRAG